MLTLVFFRAFSLFVGFIGLLALPCAQAFPTMADNEQLFQVANGQPISPSDLLNSLNQADVSAWGEVHDNPRHHALRADLLRAMSLRGITIVAEHMDAGQGIDFRQALPDALAQAGFDATGWQWPLHQVLFEAVQQTGLALYGGNIPATQTKEVFKSQGASVSTELQHLLRQATLDDASLKLLRQEIDQGHCSALPAHMFDAMIAVQRARDASMAAMLLQHLPSVLLAGNGHAWKHLGVPQIIRANQPGVRMVSLLLIEHQPLTTRADNQEWLKSWRDKADFIWITPARSREDPCLQFQKK
jgi:uncharacterized iron-regulated protein